MLEMIPQRKVSEINYYIFNSVLQNDMLGGMG